MSRWRCPQGKHDDYVVPPGMPEPSGALCGGCRLDATYKGEPTMKLITDDGEGDSPAADRKEPTVAASPSKTTPKASSNGRVEPSYEALADLIEGAAEHVERLRAERKPTDKVMAEVSLACRRGYTMARKLQGLSA